MSVLPLTVLCCDLSLIREIAFVFSVFILYLSFSVLFLTTSFLCPFVTPFFMFLCYLPLLQLTLKPNG
jgi:hypothetical protein